MEKKTWLGLKAFEGIYGPSGKLIWSAVVIRFVVIFFVSFYASKNLYEYSQNDLVKPFAVLKDLRDDNIDVYWEFPFGGASEMLVYVQASSKEPSNLIYALTLDVGEIQDDERLYRYLQKNYTRLMKGEISDFTLVEVSGDGFMLPTAEKLEVANIGILGVNGIDLFSGAIVPGLIILSVFGSVLVLSFKTNVLFMVVNIVTLQNASLMFQNSTVHFYLPYLDSASLLKGIGF